MAAANTLPAREVAALVPMLRLFGALGLEANERTRRRPCPLHGGSNPTTFAWRDDGRWHCFSCDAGGDKISLVRAVRKCSFREALDFLAALAGIEYKPGIVSREAIEQERLTREREAEDVETLLALEFSEWRAAQDEVLRLETIRRNAGERLDAI